MFSHWIGLSPFEVVEAYDLILLHPQLNYPLRIEVGPDTRSSVVTAEEVSNTSKDDHVRYFIAFIATLLDDCSRYIHHSETIDVAIDGVGYNKFSIELSDEEFRALTTEMNAVLAPYLDYQPRINRRRRIFTSIIIPDVSKSVK